MQNIRFPLFFSLGLHSPIANSKLLQTDFQRAVLRLDRVVLGQRAFVQRVRERVLALACFLRYLSAGSSTLAVLLALLAGVLWEGSVEEEGFEGCL